MNKSKQVFFRISLRTLLVLLTGLCLWLGLKSDAARRQRHALAVVSQLGGSAGFDWHGGQPPGPPWLRDFVGSEFFQELTYVNLSRSGKTATSDDLRALAAVKSLNTLTLGAAIANDQTVAFPHVKHLTLGTVSPGSLDWIGRCPILNSLTIDQPADYRNPQLLRNEDLRFLAHLTGLEELSLSGTAITDDGLEHLRHLRNLQTLDLSDNCLTDSCLPHLSGLTKLKKLRVGKTYITSSGAANLKKLLPEVSIMAKPRPPASAEHLDAVRQIGRNGGRVTRDFVAVNLAGDREERVSVLLPDTWTGRTRDLRCLKRLPNLYSVTTHAKLGDDMLQALCQNKGVVSLRLINTNITDQGLRYLTELKNLESLTLHGPFTDGAVEYLTAVTNLKVLAVVGSQMTPEGQRKLRTTLPRAAVAQEVALPQPRRATAF